MLFLLEANIYCYYLVVQSYQTFCNPMDLSPVGFSVHGAFQATSLELVANSSSRVSSQTWDWTCVSCIAAEFFLFFLSFFFFFFFLTTRPINRIRQLHPTPVLLPGKSHGWRSLVGCAPWGRKESDTTERLYFHFSLSRIGEGNGNPRQCSCLENPRNRGAWWAAVYGVAQSQPWLK